MAELSPLASAADHEGDEISLLSLASTLLQRRRLILVLGFIGATWGLASGLTSTRVYRSSATFIPQGAEGGASAGLALAAQFGIRVPSGSGSWGPAVYVALLGSHALLEPIALDTVSVAEQGGRRVAIMDLLDIDAKAPAQRKKMAVRALQTIVSAGEIKNVGAVKVSATTPWPSVSLALANRLVRAVNVFNAEARKSQASAERQFVEVQARDAEHVLRAAEDRLQEFLQRNRSLGSVPQLAFERDRLQREVSLRQQVYTSLLQSREEARIREVRDIPVITIIEPPALALIGEPRGTIQKTTIGGVGGVLLAITIAFLSNALSVARRTPNETTQEFFRQIEAATPSLFRWLRK